MKRIIVFSVILLTGMVKANAQYTITYERNTDKKAEKPKIDLRTPARINANARYESLIKMQRKERHLQRNYVEYGGKLYFTQVMFDNWATSSNNSVSGRVEGSFKHIYKDDKFNLVSTFNTAYQMGRIGEQFRKLDDRFELNVNANYQMHKRWYYSGNVNFKSQYLPGYKYPDDSTVISRFMAPANLIVSLGLNYKPEKENFSLLLSPVSGKMIFVLDRVLSDEGRYGVDPGQRVRKEIGAYARVAWEKRIGGDAFKYKTIFTAFCNYKNAPVMGWENWIDICTIKIFTINFYCNIVYDRTAKTPRINNPWQINESFGFGISCIFKNKSKPN